MRARWLDPGPSLVLAALAASLLLAALPTGAAAGTASAPAVGSLAIAWEAGFGDGAVRGDWFRRSDDGVFAQAGLRVGVCARCYVHALYRTQFLSNYRVLTVGRETAEVHRNLRSYQLLVGVRDTGPGRGQPGMRPYCEGGVGMMEWREHGGSIDYSATRAALAAQIGLWVPAGGTVVLDVALHGFYKPGWLSDGVGASTFGGQMAMMLTR